MKIVVKFEASSVISLIPYKSCDHHALFLRNQIVEICPDPPRPPFLIFFQCICLLFSSSDLIPRKKKNYYYRN